MQHFKVTGSQSVDECLEYFCPLASFFLFLCMNYGSTPTFTMAA